MAEATQEGSKPPISISVNGHPLEAREGGNLLDCLHGHGVRLPTICHHAALSRPSGACRLCVVEVILPGKAPEVRRACLTKTSAGMVIQTESVAVQAAREKAIKTLLKQAPQSRRLLDLAASFGLRVEAPPDGCIRCGLCVRVCREIVKAEALKMERREGSILVVPIEGRCIGCGTCAAICPTQVIALRDGDGIRTISIRDEVIGRHPLEICEGCGQPFATPRFLDRVHSRTLSHHHPDLKHPHRHCPACAKRLSDRVKAQNAHTLR
jgi:predicted molibdopterin-dependent oxidoreductase YjgC